MTRKVLVIRLGSLGDIILSSAPILNLKIANPFSEITVLTKSKHAEVARMIPGVDKVVTIPDSPGIMEYAKKLIELDKSDFDIIVDLQNNARSMLARKFLTSSQKLVYSRDRSIRKRIVRQKDFPNKITHTIDRYNEILDQLHLKPFAKRPVLELGGEKIQISGRKQIVIAPGASFENKQWPIQRFADVALELYSKHDLQIVWAITSADKEKVRINEKIAQEFVTELVDCPIDKLAKIIRQSELCLANDSGIAHLSSAVGTPVLTIFGPTHPALGFAPRGLFDKVIEVDEFCRPCSLHGDKPCFRSERFCFTRITSAMIVEQAAGILERNRSSSRALFVDRDGTVIVDKPFDSNPGNIEFENGSVEALKKAQLSGFKIVIVSNQSGIARGYFKYQDAERFNNELVRQLKENGVIVSAIYFCPHYPSGKVREYSFVCNCRKPAAGMVEKAADDLNIDIRRSYVVGDKTDDYNLGIVSGMKSFLVKTGQGENYIEKLRKISENPEYDICENLNGAVNRILESEKA